MVNIEVIVDEWGTCKFHVLKTLSDLHLPLFTRHHTTKYIAKDYYYYCISTCFPVKFSGSSPNSNRLPSEGSFLFGIVFDAPQTKHHSAWVLQKAPLRRGASSDETTPASQTKHQRRRRCSWCCFTGDVPMDGGDVSRIAN